MPFKGTLQIQTFDGESYIPIENATVTVTETSGELTRQPKQIVRTNSSGLTQELELAAPSIDNSMKPSDKLPYSLCDLNVTAPGYTTQVIKGCQIYPNTLAVQQCKMKKSGMREEEELIDILPNRLVGNYPPKIPEDPNKPDPVSPSGFVVLAEPVVPQFIIVHAGVPDDPSAPNYTVGFRDYIKNVASCEIFSTWPESTVRANILCIISFTLNRIYTEWYRGKGKNFNITNSTAYDHAFVYGRNIYANISRIVDDIFSTYVKRPGKKQPLLTQYCDGTKVQCPGWLTQWGSKYLGDQGKAPFQILQNFYGADLILTTAKKVSGIPKSYPGYPLKVGSRGPAVRTIQTYLNRISVDYPAIPKVAADGVYGQGTNKAVSEFQKIFQLVPTGIVNYGTWYSISNVYVAVTKIGELRGVKSDNYAMFNPPRLFNDGTLTPTIMYPEDDMQ